MSAVTLEASPEVIDTTAAYPERPPEAPVVSLTLGQAVVGELLDAPAEVTEAPELPDDLRGIEEALTELLADPYGFFAEHQSVILAATTDRSTTTTIIPGKVEQTRFGILKANSNDTSVAACDVASVEFNHAPGDVTHLLGVTIETPVPDNELFDVCRVSYGAPDERGSQRTIAFYRGGKLVDPTLVDDVTAATTAYGVAANVVFGLANLDDADDPIAKARINERITYQDGDNHAAADWQFDGIYPMGLAEMGDVVAAYDPTDNYAHSVEMLCNDPSWVVNRNVRPGTLLRLLYAK